VSIPAPRLRDVALVAAAAVALIVEGGVRAKGFISPAECVLAIAAASPLAWRSRAPVATLVAVEVGAILCVVAFRAGGAATAMVLVVLYTVAREGDRRRSVAIGAATAVGATATLALIDGSLDLPDLLPRLLLVVVVLAVGDTVRSRRALREAERERVRRETREREEEGQRRVVDERLRIARELHDTLAHSLVAINVRAGVAADLSDSQDPLAALRDIKQVSAAALRDLRATLGLLRQRDDAAPTTPASDLASLPSLADDARSAGLRTDMDIRVEAAAVPSTIAGATFRIVQEALTNVLRHADATSARVSVRSSRDTLDIEITDDGRANGAAARSGLGLRGMAERAEALGGALDVGPRKEGGWRVHAVLPLDDGDAR
jgi:signal transduction histidine kinase